ncbi:MAG: RdgB/HAM1 family non-canonical purine NTP pyrophosphatase [Dehalococcoidia bacterium]
MGRERKLLLGTQNRGKISELKELIGSSPFIITTPLEEGVTATVDEYGATYEENASIKAKTYAVRSDLIALADDSGLEVDALDGAPGPLSARYAGPDASDRDHIARLLKELSAVPWEGRTARFVSVIAIATPSGKVEFSRGVCEGIIALEPTGESGFGYDPVFYIPEIGKTMAQLTMKEKNRISHRARAMRQALPLVARLFRDYDVKGP